MEDRPISSRDKEGEGKGEHPVIMKLEKVKGLGSVKRKARKLTPDKVRPVGKEKKTKCVDEKKMAFHCEEAGGMQVIGSSITSETDRMR